MSSPITSLFADATTNESIEKNSSAKTSKLIYIPHIEQREGWDCGLASVEMVVRALVQKDAQENLKENIFKVAGICTIQSNFKEPNLFGQSIFVTFLSISK